MMHVVTKYRDEQPVVIEPRYANKFLHSFRLALQRSGVERAPAVGDVVLGVQIVALRDETPPAAPRGHLTTLRRIYLNRGGYDSAGSYWGHGLPLYTWEVEDDPTLYGTLRAASREHAKRQLRESVSNDLTFHR